MSLPNIPDAQRGRQAVASLAGYAYQVYASVAQWLRLGTDEILLLEVAEDYATLATSVLSMTQVKNEPAARSITLRGDGPIKAIVSLWEHQEANPDLAVRLNYLSTASPGREHGFEGPEGLGAIEYWRRAAAGGPLAALRKLLFTLPLPPALQEFIRTADDEKLRIRLLRPLHWNCKSPSLDATRAALEERLISIAADRGLLAPDGLAALPALVDAVLSCIVTGNRRLTRSDFEKAFASAASIPIGRDILRSLTSGMGGSAETTIAGSTESGLNEGALPTRLARRSQLVDELKTDLALRGALWLHGSSGLGKTLLAKLVVGGANRRWHLVELRSSDAGKADRQLRAVLRTVGDIDFGGVVLDDLTVDLARANAPRLEAIARAVAEADGQLIITSDRAPGPLVLRTLEPTRPIAREAPYLDVEDVAEIVTSAGGDPDRWAAILHLTCGFGHPQLVDARVVGLASRVWPANERFDGLIKAGPPTEIEAVRDEITLRLLSELAAEPHELLLRLSLVVGGFDRELALALGELAPAVGRAGAWFDLLVGPWVEKKGENSYTVSPLVSQAGAKSRTREAQGPIHVAIVDHLLTRRPFPASLLSTLLAHTLLARHIRGFWFIAGVIMTNINQALVVQSMPLLPLLLPADGLRLVPEEPVVSATLRVCQLIVASRDPDHRNLDDLIAGASAEFDLLPPEIGDNLKLMSLMTVLGSEHVSAGPTTWLPLLLEYERFSRSPNGVAEEIGQELGNVDLGGLAADEFFFVIRTRRMTTVHELEDLFELLEPVEPATRGRWLRAEAKLLGGTPLFVQNAWSREDLAGSLDGNREEARYSRLAEIAERWGEREVAIECIRARAVMLDEYVGDATGALGVLDAADAQHPNEARLARARAAVLANAGRHEEAHVILGGIAETYSADEPIERALMLRSAAISAAKSGALNDAVARFRDAREAAMPAQTWDAGTRTGLLADIGLLEFQRGDRVATLETFMQALHEADQLNHSTSDQAWYTVHIVPEAIKWVLNQVRGAPQLGGIVPEPGVCSLISPKAPEGRAIDLPKRAGWYFLAQLEVLWNLSLGASKRLQAIEELEGSVLPLAVQLALDRLDAVIRTRDIEQLFTLLPPFASIMKATSELAAMPAAERRMSEPKPLPTVLLDESSVTIAGVRAAVVTMIVRLLLDGDDALARMVANRAAASSTCLTGLLPDPSPPLLLPPDHAAGAVSSLAWVLSTQEPSPDELLAASCRLFEWLRPMPTPTIARALHTALAGRWLSVARNRRALLRLPQLSVPEIEAAAANPRADVAALAKLILAASLATSIRLSENMLAMLMSAAEVG